MKLLKHLKVTTDQDLSRVRRAVTARADVSGLSLLNRTRLVTAASELARNLLTYGGGGLVSIVEIRDRGRVGVKATFEDKGPGISDLDEAMSDGFSSGRGLGLGLGGARRLVDEFDMTTRIGEGTTISIATWARRTRRAEQTRQA